jgi:hypothetical protein
MNSYFKSAALCAAAIFLLAGFEAKASAALNDPADIPRNVPAHSISKEEPADAQCDLVLRMQLTGASGRSQAGDGEDNSRSSPAVIERPVFVKNPFLSTAP